MRTAIVLLGTTGLRITEAVTILKKDIDHDNRTVKVYGKGGKWRNIPLLDSTLAVLVWWMETYPSDSEYLFPGEGAEEKDWQIHNAEKTLKRACLRAGGKPFTPHALRHLFATESLKNGAKLEVVSRILGHASVGITGDIYRHVGKDEMLREVDLHAPLNGSGKAGTGAKNGGGQKTG
jgi:integrase/recombinase XerD